MKTPWFNAVTQPPVRIGVYEVQFGVSGKRWSYWDGVQWCFSSYFKETAMRDIGRSALMYHPDSKWRGMLK